MPKYKVTYTQNGIPDEDTFDCTSRPDKDLMMSEILNKGSKRDTEHPSESSQISTRQEITQKLEAIGVDPDSIKIL